MSTKLKRIAAARAEAELQLKEALSRIRKGEFIEIKRTSRRAEMSVVAHRYTGDIEQFTKVILFAFEDAADALHEGQWLSIEITT